MLERIVASHLEKKSGLEDEITPVRSNAVGLKLDLGRLRGFLRMFFEEERLPKEIRSKFRSVYEQLEDPLLLTTRALIHFEETIRAQVLELPKTLERAKGQTKNDLTHWELAKAIEQVLEMKYSFIDPEPYRQALRMVTYLKR